MPTNFQFLVLLSIFGQKCFAVRNQKVSEYPSTGVSWFAVSKLIFLVFCFYKMSLIIAKFVRLLIFSCLRANSTFYTYKTPPAAVSLTTKLVPGCCFLSISLVFSLSQQTIKSHLQSSDLLPVCPSPQFWDECQTGGWESFSDIFFLIYCRIGRKPYCTMQMDLYKII